MLSIRVSTYGFLRELCVYSGGTEGLTFEMAPFSVGLGAVLFAPKRRFMMGRRGGPVLQRPWERYQL
jgi:hypothetical protein